MQAKKGDRVSLDAKQVGQPRRSGVVRAVTKGLSGTRLEIEWTDGGRSVIAPAAGTLLVEGKAKPAVKKPAARKPAVKKPAARKPAVKKPAARKPAVKKPAAKKRR